MSRNRTQTLQRPASAEEADPPCAPLSRIVFAKRISGFRPGTALKAEVAFSVLMLAGVVLSAITHKAVERNEALLLHRLEVVRTSESILSLMKDAETGERGFLLTSAPRYLEPFTTAVAEAPGELSHLQELLSHDEAAPIQSIGRLVSSMIQELQAIVELHRSGKAAAALSRVRAGRVERMMDAMRVSVGELELREQSRLSDHLEHSRASRFRSRALALSLVFTGFLFLIWSARVRRREEKKNRIITRQLLDYSGELEVLHTSEVEATAGLRRLNEELSAAKAKADRVNQARAEFTARISHELRTPLRGVIGMSQLAIHSDSLAEARECALSIHSCANSLTALLNDMLDSAKAEAGRLVLSSSPFNLYGLCREQVQLFRPHAEQKGLQLGFSYQGSCPRRFIGDEKRVRQVITNLMTNAIKFTAEGSINLAVEWDTAPISGNLVHIRLIDTGIGIPSDRLLSIFEPYEQADASTSARFGGTGLGLTISRQLARLMQGSISVKSIVGKGSEFTVSIPLVPDESTYAKPPGTEDRGDAVPQGLRVLVADDSGVNRTVCTRSLAGMGVLADSVPDGLAAVKACLRQPYDLVLMDCNMPGMDGYEAARIIRQSMPPGSVRIVALTADVTAECQAACRSAGMDDFLTKPIDISSLRACLRSVQPQEIAGRPMLT
jgi:signal transduction histidine kinase/ActR/RegA family two-component response regulator